MHIRIYQKCDGDIDLTRIKTCVLSIIIIFMAFEFYE